MLSVLSGLEYFSEYSLSAYPVGLVLACGAYSSRALTTIICFQEPADDEAARLCCGIQETPEPACTDVHDDSARTPIQGEKTVVGFLLFALFFFYLFFGF